MAVTQYIGARYVPIFADPPEWSSTRQYEPLTIVLHQGNSFTSKQYVPVGVDINDTEYWAETGNWNSQVEAYRQQVLQLEREWPIWKEQTRVDLEEEIQPVTGIIPSSAFTTQNTVKDYIDKKSAFAGTNVLCITDSWGSENVYGVTECWMRMVCDALGANYIDLHQGSTGFVTPPTFLTRTQNYVASNPDMVDKINYVIVCGGNNDVVYPDATIRGAMQDTMRYIVRTFPNATIFYVPQISGIDMNKCSAASTSYNAWVKAAYNSYWSVVNDIDWTRDVIFVQALQYCLVGMADTFMNSDFIHPTQLGHNRIASKFLSSILGGTQPALVPMTIDMTTVYDNNDNAIPITNGQIRCYITATGTIRISGRFAAQINDWTNINTIKIKIPKVVAINNVNYISQQGIAIHATPDRSLPITPNLISPATKTLGPNETTEASMSLNIPIWTALVTPGLQIFAVTYEGQLTF